jgi:nickel/cobalt transporter (NicO) family protein
MNNLHRFMLTGVAAVVVVFLSDPASAQGVSFGALHHASAIMPQSGLVAWIFAKQAAFYRSMSSFIRASKDDGTAMWDLFGISFLYGVFHAVGPGHGKAVISSYLVANEESWRRGVILSFLSAGIQSVVAIVVVAIAAVLLGATAKAIGLTVHVVETVSYVLVILIGLRLLFVKGRGFIVAYRELMRQRASGTAATSSAEKDKIFHRADHDLDTMAVRCDHGHDDGHAHHVHGPHCHDHHDHHGHDHHASAWGHAHGPEPAELAGVGGWRRGLSAVIAVGLRPCSGAIIVLIFALAQELFWTGTAATLIMGLGTAMTVAAIATVAVSARTVASRIATARSGLGTLMMRGIEVGAAALIVAFGALLLVGYMASEQLWMFTG